MPAQGPRGGSLGTPLKFNHPSPSHTLPPYPPHPCRSRLRRRCQVPQRITPGRVRHLMVTFANNNPAVFGGREDVVASVMGHHVRMWREVYDKAVNRRNVELAAEAVAAVRRTVIAELEEVQRQAADAAMIAAAAAAVLAAAEAVGADVGQPVDGEGESQYVSALAEVEESGEEVEGGLDTLAAAAVEAAAAAAWAEADEEAAAAELDVSEDECMEMLFTSDDEDCLIDGEGEEE
ncbi:hypothetical protein COHA_010440 [Chlorella ohadii]|uniref:Uncharacterized protein n=1 Tax=Chlorella ohadii TaxID=2649997 RepID=A0AAD5GX05_9CHLO|nr:hypothetical protein COHA_010440 [Chlorella ohadii]